MRAMPGCRALGLYIDGLGPSPRPTQKHPSRGRRRSPRPCLSLPARHPSEPTAVLRRGSQLASTPPGLLPPPGPESPSPNRGLENDPKMSSCRWKKYLDTFSHIGAENTCFKNSTGSYAPCRTLFAGFFTLWPIIGDFYIPLEVLHRAAPTRHFSPVRPALLPPATWQSAAVLHRAFQPGPNAPAAV